MAAASTSPIRRRRIRALVSWAANRFSTASRSSFPKSTRAGLSNVRILNDDARFLLERLAPASLARVFILYPDPWPKKRHNKRRFINEETLGFLARTLKPGGELRFASDIPDYIAWTLAHVSRFNREEGEIFLWTAESAVGWRTPYEGWPGTRYEAKAIREGRTPRYLSFRRA